MRIFQNLVEALRFAHENGIAHRDLKPENILIDPNTYAIKLIDFGLSREANKNTIAKTSCGSPHYVAPEIAQGIEYDPKKADLWSLGVVLFALATSTLPFDHENISELLKMITKGDYTIPSTVGTMDGTSQPIDPEIIYLIKGLLKTDPQKRFNLSKVEKKIRRFWRQFEEKAKTNL
jgi:BR serine/threonine kinase